MVLKIAKIDLFDRDALISAIPLMAPYDDVTHSSLGPTVHN